MLFNVVLPAYAGRELSEPEARVICGLVHEADCGVSCPRDGERGTLSFTAGVGLVARHSGTSHKIGHQLPADIAELLIPRALRVY